MTPLHDLSPRGRLVAGRFHLPERPDGEVLSRCPYDPGAAAMAFPFAHDDVPEAVVAASRAARGWGARTVSERMHLLSRLRPELVRRAPLLLKVLVQEGGRPPWECQREIHGLLSRLDHSLGAAPDQLADRGYGQLPARVLSRPLGAVAVLGPAMLPLSTSHTHLVAALCAGNTVVWKPSPLCPAAAQLYAEAYADAGLPPGVFNFIQGGDDVGAALCAQQQLDGVVFTGTPDNGRAVRHALIDRVELRQVLHLGAKNAAVVLDDTDIELAAYEVLTAAFQSAGQRCTATSRVLVHTAVLDEFLTTLLALIGTLRIGPPGDDIFMGPLLSEARMARFCAAREAARSGGAEVLLPGERLDLPGWFQSPSVHLVPQEARDPRSPYQRDELFGPDLCVYPVRDVDDAFALCDDGPLGLCAALFTDTPMRWKRFSEEARAGALFWNRGTGAPSGLLPFGGDRGSALGGRGGADAVLALRREVSLLGRASDEIDTLPGTLSRPPGPGDNESDHDLSDDKAGA